MAGLEEIGQSPLSASDASGLDISLDSLTTFKNGVDELLKDLEDSAAAPKAMGEQQISAAHLGRGFSEADSLMSAYTHVHGQLKLLSKTLAEQIESMSLLVHMAKNDYRNVDEEQSFRLWDIWQLTQRHYEAARRGDRESTPAPDPGKPQSNESTAGGTM